MQQEDIRKAILLQVQETTALGDRAVTDDTEIYEDLRIWGEDFYELIDWIRAKFGADFSAMNCSLYCPPEGIALWSRSFRSCTVRMLVDAAVAGRWQDVL